MTLRAGLSALFCLVAALSFAAEPSAGEIWPDAEWSAAKPDDVGADARLLEQARDYALTAGGAGCIVGGGRLVMSWGETRKRFDLKSTTKSIGMTAVGLALQDGKFALADRAQTHCPGFGTPPDNNASTGWLDRITLLHLATQTAGFEKPGGYGKLLFEPGTQWSYSDGGPNWLAECVTRAYRQDIDDLMFSRVFTPLGITRRDLVWRTHSYRPKTIDGIPSREFGSGVSANVDAMARLGYLYLREGRWRDRQILPRDFVRMAGTPVAAVVGLPVSKPEEYGQASNHYGLLWWNNGDGTLADVPRDAFWSWGLYDSLIVVVPSRDLVIARAGESWKRTGGDHYDVLKPFLGPIARAVPERPPVEDDLLERAPQSMRKESDARPAVPAPCPPSRVIHGIEWAPVSSIVRAARGSDNWPMTWAGGQEGEPDGVLFTAYGDGRGFDPLVERKLSLGLARIAGGAGDFRAVNLRSPSAEQVGDGVRGRKASGLLMVDGVLLMLVRNAGNAQLAWSQDRGTTWESADWRFSESFGCPTFLNSGRDYEGAQDDFVYIYSHDSDSAYRPADRMVLARVDRRRLRERDRYEFFAGLDGSGNPVWSPSIERREGVFRNPGRCYRSSVSYNGGLKRYLWCQTLPGDDPRFAGGFGIYDAPEPWGPWTTVFHTDRWDTGPGETMSIPTKWISPDGLTIHLVFSGEDCFSVRRGQLIPVQQAGRNAVRTE